MTELRVIPSFRRYGASSSAVSSDNLRRLSRAHLEADVSGLICEIVIRGNRAQANTRFALSHDSMPLAAYLQGEQLIGGFQSLCSLGTVYDGSEVMTDAQQQQAVDLMGAYNDAIEPLLLAKHTDAATVASIIAGAHANVYALLAAVVANP